MKACGGLSSSSDTDDDDYDGDAQRLDEMSVRSTDEMAQFLDDIDLESSCYGGSSKVIHELPAIYHP
jgi:hypothetical protein